MLNQPVLRGKGGKQRPQVLLHPERLLLDPRSVDMEHEGGYSDNPHDRGNWTGGKVGVGTLKGTNRGISAAQFPSEDIEHLTVDQIKNIYLNHYWNPLYAQIKEQSICNKLFDLGVLFGSGTAVERLQEAMRGAFPMVVDGKFGSATLMAVNSSEPISLLAAYKTVFVSHVVRICANNPNERAFFGDWVRRINS